MNISNYRLLLLIIVFFYGVNQCLWAQETCPIELQADIQNCNCLNDGVIRLKLTSPTDCDIDSLNIRYSLFSSANGIHNENSTTSVFSNLPPGDYIGIVSVLIHTGEPGVGANIIVYDTLSLSLSTTYKEPTIGMVENEYSAGSPFGKVRTLPCVNTGIIQLYIRDGLFPYHVNVYQHNGSDYQFYKDVVFDTIQHHGTDAGKMDYMAYYDIDSLPAGNYKFLLTDACGYTPPEVSTTLLTTPSLSSTTTIKGDAHNRDPYSHNTFYIIESGWPTALNNFAKQADYYAERQKNGLETYWEYRWIDPSVNGGIPDTSSWQPIVFETMYHTVNAAGKFCDIWGKSVLLQIRDVNCSSSISYTYTIIKPQRVFNHQSSLSEIPGTSQTLYDSCGVYRTNVSKINYSYAFSAENEKQQMFTVYDAGARMINYAIKDAIADTVIMQGTSPVDGGKVFSYRNEFSFDPKYHGKTANFRVYDAHSCLISDETFTISAQEISTLTTPTLIISESNIQNSYCQHSTVDLNLTNSIFFSDHDTISIIESPGNLSNITAYYDAGNDLWVRCDSNSSISTSGDQYKLVIAGVKEGYLAVIHYKRKCLLQEYNYNLGASPNVYRLYYVPTPASYQVEPCCNGIRIIPTAGSYITHRCDPLNNEMKEQETNGYFRLYGNPNSPSSITGYYQLGDTIEITMEGDIKIEQCLTPNTTYFYSCLDRATTIPCHKGVLQYNYFYSYCCHLGDTVSTVRTRAKGGVPPYTYTVSDRNGNILDANQTGDFYNLPLPHHDTVFLNVNDQCGTSFIYKGQVIEQQLIKKTWFEDGSNFKTLSDSNWCQLFAITFDDISYHWDGPNGFSTDEQNPAFFIPVDSNMSGQYYLSLQDSTCGLIQDSLRLKVLTKNHVPELIWIEDSICSGQNYEKNGFSIPSSPSEETKLYYDTIISLMDDSTFLKLTILPVYNSSKIDSVITSLDHYPYGGMILSDTGLHVIKLKTGCECDSTVLVHLMFSKYLPCPDAIDYNGNSYPTLRINKYCWTTENLKSLNYSDGRPIERIYEYYAHEYPNTLENVNIFGRLYDWYAAIDSSAHLPPDSNGNVQGICPAGWLLPTDEDFETLYIYTTEQLRATNYWLHPGSNESGFNSLPAGYYDAFLNRYSNLLGDAYYCCANKNNGKDVTVHLFYDCMLLTQRTSCSNGYSVRCIKKN